MPMHFSPRKAASGHPFRRELARRGHPLRRAMQRRRGHPIRGLLNDRQAAVPSSARNEDQDLKLFVLSFTAFFVCFAAFIF